VKPYRSSLFVPGNKPNWMKKAVNYEADVLVLDLEDSVPAQEKVEARAMVRDALPLLKENGQRCSVRINGFASELTLGDLEGIICPELESVAIPKIETVDEMKQIDTLLTHLEMRQGIELGTIKTPLNLETAKAMYNAYDIAISSPRVTDIALAAGPGGDASRSVGYVWSKEGRETLYLRSKIVLDSRAAGIQYPTISSWWNIRDLEGLERDARLNRQLGFRGQAVIHPSHIPIVNAVFSPTTEEIEYSKGLIAAMAKAEKKGTAAVVYRGDMVDYAMLQTAKEMIEFTESIGMVA